MDQTEEYIKRVLKVLVHIEAHIDEEMNLHDLAKFAHYSPFHFHRIFHCVVGESVHQYVKRLRLEKAALKLRDTSAPVTEIALDVSYDTPSSFTKAFKLHMGKSPKDFRALTQTSKNTLYKIAKEKIEELPMIYPEKIEKIPDLEVLFIRKKGSYAIAPWEAWKAMGDFRHESNIDESQMRCFSLLHDDPNITAEEKIRFDACILATPGLKENGEVGRRVIQGGKYAIFTHFGPYERFEETFGKIYVKWAPNTQEVIDEIDRPPFCEHLNMHYVDIEPEKLFSKIYIPLK